MDAQREKTMQQLKKEYLKEKNSEISFEEWLKIQKDIERLKKQNSSKRIACNPVYDPTGCTNGDFNSNTLGQNAWQGEFGMLVINSQLPNNGTIDESTFTCGISGGSIDELISHLTIVANDTDPLIPALRTTPDNTGYSLRIGNAIDGAHAEMINKSFKVNSNNSNFTFDYAVVLEDPGSNHTPNELPTFKVVVTDETTNSIVNGLVDLDGSGNNYVRTDNPAFFNQTSTSFTSPNILGSFSNTIHYSDWLCAQIDLSSLIGKNVTVSFITEDCGQGGHFAYAYIDNVCSGCSNAPYSMSFAQGRSSDCGLPANICFDYTIPSGQNLNIKLTAQSGSSTLQTWNSPSISNGSNYCFSINSINGIGNNQTVNFSASGNFSNAPTQSSGISGYKINCGGGSDECNCCPGKNLVKNGSFENGKTGFSTSFQYYDPNAKSNVYPAIYSILNATQALAESPDWKLKDMDCCSPRGGKPTDKSCCNKQEKFLVINGRNNQPAGTHTIIYQTSNSSGPVGTPIITQGMRRQFKQYKGKPIKLNQIKPTRGPLTNLTTGRKKNYKFCVRMKHLGQSTFDIIPEGKIVIIDSQGNAESINYELNRNTDPCYWDILETTFAGVAPFTVSISLREDRSGDGNDLAIDDVSIVEIAQVKKTSTLFNVSTNFISASQYNVTASQANRLPAGCKLSWTICEIENGKCKNGTGIKNPIQWQTASTSFNGYNGTASLSQINANNKGFFDITKTYQIKFGVSCDCASLNETIYKMSFDPQLRMVLVKDPKGKIKFRGKLNAVSKKSKR